MNLRPYQEDVVKKMIWSMGLEGNEIVMVAQGGGKTLIIAEFTARLGQPILILVPSKELLQQDYDKLAEVVSKDEIGIYSASMNSKEIKKYTLATIQSAYKHPEQFAHYDVVIIDECDLVPLKNLSGMYRSFFKAIGVKKIFGLTGTPFRQDIRYEYPPNYRGLAWQKMRIKAVTITKMLNRYTGFFWSRMLCVINTHELLSQGYLSPLEYHEINLIEHKDIKTNKSQSEFDFEDFEEQIEKRYKNIVNLIKSLPHKSKLVFCSSVKQAEILQSLVEGSAVVTGTTRPKERQKTIEGLKNGSINTVFNVSVLTVGFDYPELECLVLLRPCRSLRLHCQILGRVARIAEGKTVGHVYDLVSNVKNMGKLEEIRVGKNSENKWDVMGGMYPDGFHNKELYSYTIKQKK